MSKSSEEETRVGNSLLGKLSRKELDRLSPHLRLVRLEKGQALLNPGDPVKYVYFPENCLISFTAVTEKGHLIQIGVAGVNGMLGVTALLRTNKTFYRSVVLTPGEAWRISAEVLRAEFNQGGKLQDVALRYTHTVIVQLAQSAVCNRCHKVEMRLCRWLLESQAESGRNILPVTHEILATMLGAPRTLITMTVARLERIGAIRRERGRVTILNPERLKHLSCECHQVVRNAIAEVLEL